MIREARIKDVKKILMVDMAIVGKLRLWRGLGDEVAGLEKELV